MKAPFITCLAALLALTSFAAPGVRADRSLVPVPDSGTVTTVDDQDAGWTWSGMAEVDDPQFHGGTAHAGGEGTYCAYTFHGTGVKVIGLGGRSIALGGHRRTLGSAKVTIDGKPVAWQPAGTPADGLVTLFETSGLTDGNHVLSVAADGGWIVIDDIQIVEAQQQAASKDDPSQGRLYRLQPRNAPGKFLETVSNVYDDGTRTEIRSAQPGSRQIWRIASVGNGLFRISPQDAPSKALTFSNDKDSNDIAAAVYTWSGAPAQEWTFKPQGDGYYEVLSAVDNTHCLDVQYGGTNDGTFALAFPYNGGDNQKWQFVPVDGK
jgi:uncharacterized Zn-binding protein involved in type VI secretion